MFGISPSYGGTEAVMYSMLEYFIKSGVEFDFINTFDVHLAKEDWLLSLGCNIIPLNLRKRGRYIKYRRELKKFFHKNSNNYDAIWINIQEPELGDVLNIAKKTSIRKRIVVAHNAGSPRRTSFIRKLSLWLSKRQIQKYASHRIAVSSLAGVFNFGKKVGFDIIRSGIDINRFRFDAYKREVMRQSLGLAHDERLYLFAGRLAEQKNPIFALSVFFHIVTFDQQARCLFVGDGNMSTDLEKQVQEQGLEKRILFVHNITDISPQLCAADFFVFPSLYEGMGMSLIEAQCSGLPCFASDGPIPKETEVTNLVHRLPLKAGPKRWAEEILATPIAENREDSYKALLEAELDHASVAKKYIEILNKSHYLHMTDAKRPLV